MKRLIGIAALIAMSLGLLPAANAGTSEGGVSSDNVEWLQHVPFEVGSATGAKVIGDYLYVTSWKAFSIYDVSDPLAPTRLSTTPFGFKFENEDVATNGKILLFSESVPQNILHVWDVEDKTSPTEIATLAGGAGHTTECILDCKYAYDSNGTIVDLRKPTAPKVVGNWGKGMPAPSGHDVNEVAPGLVLTSSRPFILLDARKDPVHPKLLGVGDDKSITGGIHSNRWPQRATDDIVLFSSESNFTGRCTGNNGAFMTWDASNYKRTHQFQLLDAWQFENGTYTDGKPAANAMGCSAHWFQERPDFDNGGIVALGSYDHGTRFMDVSSAGKIKEVGFFEAFGGETSAAYWLTNDIVYSVDYSRGIDILKFKD